MSGFPPVVYPSYSRDFHLSEYYLFTNMRKGSSAEIFYSYTDSAGLNFLYYSEEINEMEHHWTENLRQRGKFSEKKIPTNRVVPILTRRFPIRIGRHK